MTKENTNKSHDHNRRKFLVTMSMALGSGALLAKPRNPNGASAIGALTVGQVMDMFIKEVPGAPFEKTVDTLKAGSRDTVITGIVTTMFPTLAVIQKTISLGANFIIVHEPSFYNHQDDTAWLTGSDVYQYKADLLKKNNIAIWRNHDYIHSLQEDGVRAGVLAQLGWTSNYKPGESVVQLSSIKLDALVNHVKDRLGVPALRYEGDLSQSCSKILLMPGAAGGRRQIENLIRTKPDVLICGEVSEWETPEYVRDAIGKGDKLALIVIGHSASEEAGSEFMANWLKGKISGIPVTHIESYNSLKVL
jgi:putative NIF3 family GTP cyclohydrolase 1 type 2